MRTHIKVFFTALLMVWGSIVWAQPSWYVNPNEYVHSMTLTGKVVIDGEVSVDENDIVAAFIDGKCRGVAKVSYQEVLDDYLVFLMIYSNDQAGTVTLKIYDVSADKEIDVATNFNFEINGIVGSVSEPYSFIAQTKVYEAKILSFSVPNMVGSATITSNTVKLKVSDDTDRSGLKATFSLSGGAKAYVNGKLQESGVTANDFRSTVIYTIKPQVGSDRIYSVEIGKSSTSSTTMSLLDNSVPENTEDTYIGKIQVQSSTLGSSYSLELVDAVGTQNEMFYLKGFDLYAREPFNFEKKNQYKVNVKVDNKKGVSMQQLFIVNVTDENDPPTNIAVTTRTLSETTVINQMVARLSVVDEDVGDVHSIAFKEGNGSNDNGNDYFRIYGDSLVLLKALSGIETDSITIFLTVTDSCGACFDKSWSFNIVDINFAPEFQSTPLNYAIQNQVYVYLIQVTDNENELVNVSFDSLPSWLVYNELTNLLSGVPNNCDVGMVQFTIIASDGNKVSSQAVVISVLNINDAPEINSYPGTQFFRVGKENAVSLPENCIVDPDIGDVLSFSLSTENNSNLPDWLSFDKETLTLRGNPTEEHIGKYNLKLTAIDRGRLKEWLVFTLDVTLPTAIDDTYSNNKFKLYPNPVQQRLYLGIPQGEIAEISIHNLHGQLVRKLELNGGTLSTIMVEALVPGIYLVKFHQGKNTYVEQIIKQ